MTKPDHYNQGHECWDIMEEIYGREQVMIFCKLNAFKYLYRCDHKGDWLNDLRKANTYLEKCDELYSKEQEELRHE